MEIESGLEQALVALEENYTSSLAGTLGIELLSVKRGELTARMPVDQRTKQPFGILHGGASVALAETLASIGGWILAEQKRVVGLEINANHVRSASSGFVLGTARVIHHGKRTQVWEVKISNEEEKLVCISRCTLAVFD